MAEGQYLSFNLQYVMMHSIMSVVFVVSSFFIFSSLFELYLYHTRIVGQNGLLTKQISENLTTHEDISLPLDKAQRKEALLTSFAFDQGIVSNWLYAVRTVVFKANNLNVC